MDENHDPSAEALDRFERSLRDAALSASVEVVHAGSDRIEEFRDRQTLQISRWMLDTGKRILFYRWDRGVLLGGWVYVIAADETLGHAKLNLDGPWVYWTHLSRNRCEHVPEDPRTNFDGKTYGSHDWVLEEVMSWVIELRDLPASRYKPVPGSDGVP